MLADRAGVALPKQEEGPQDRKRREKRDQLYEINKLAAEYFYRLLRSDKGKMAKDYFTRRELSPETMQKFGLGYSDKYSDDLYRFLKSKGYSDELLKDSGLVVIDEVRGGHDKFWNRAMFPIMNEHGKVIAFGGRVMGEGEPKYLNSPETEIFNKSRTMYGFYLARKTRRPQVILCEGYMDVIALHQAGFDNALASLGTALTSGHVGMLRRLGKDVYISYDSDHAGQDAAIRAIPMLKEAGITCKIINMEPYKDPDEFIKALGTEEYQKRIDEAENSFLFLIRMLQRDYDLRDPESKSKFFYEVAKRILEFPEQIERESYIEAVADRYQVGFDNLRQMVNNLGTKQGLISSEPARQLKSGIQKKKTKEDAMMQSQRLLLTWMVEKPEIYRAIKAYINPEDFTEGIYHTVAEELFAQFDSGEALNPGRIVDKFFENEEDQRLVAQMFNTSVKGMDENSDWEKAIRETLVKVKRNSYEEKRKKMDPADPNMFTLIIEEKNTIQALQKVHLAID